MFTNVGVHSQQVVTSEEEQENLCKVIFLLKVTFTQFSKGSLQYLI